MSNIKRLGFEVLAINLDKNKLDAKHFLKRYPVQFPVLYKVPSAQLNAYQIEALPLYYLIDQKGNIIQSFKGFKKSHLRKQ